MRLAAIIIAAASVVACSQPAPAQAQGGANAAQTEDEAAYMARCRRETLAAYPGAAAQVDSICASTWEQVIAAGPMADVILAVAPAPGGAFNTADARTRAASLRGYETVVGGSAPAALLIQWFRNGEPIPFNLEDALRVRGATVAMIGCQSFGAGEGSRLYRIDAAGKAPFALTVSFRNAAVASQSSDFAASADYSGRIPTLADINRREQAFEATCP